MDAGEVDHVTRILQLSITPVALISGVGLLLLSMTNRLGRVIDRARDVGKAAAALPEDPDAAAEIRVLFRRARLLQLAIALVATSIFTAALMIAAIFLMHVATAGLARAVLALFGACLACLVTSLALFLADIFLSIRWLRLSLGRYA